MTSNSNIHNITGAKEATIPFWKTRSCESKEEDRIRLPWEFPLTIRVKIHRKLRKVMLQKPPLAGIPVERVFRSLLKALANTESFSDSSSDVCVSLAGLTVL
jgi:hypothetical protein